MNKNKLITVVGLGKTGLSCIRYLTEQKEAIIGIDNCESFSEFYQNTLNQADTIILSPGISLKNPTIAHQIKQGTPVIGDIELFALAAKAPIVAITGSNGKSTVTTLVGAMAKTAGLKVKIGGNLGTPALDLLDNDADLYVLELSSFQLETTYSLKAAAAVVLNISPDHMDRYQNIEEYTAAKMRIYNGCKTAITPPDLNEPKPGEFGIRDSYLAYGLDNLLPITDLRIKGQHQIANALAALALGTAVKLPMPAMLQTLREFKGLPHRCQWVAKINGVDWYNDSKGTNVGATMAAIEGCRGDPCGRPHSKIILIAGGQGKDADFSVLRDAIEKHVRTLILIGEDAAKIAKALIGTTKIIHADSMRQAVITAKKAAQSGDIVLLSPACASFDMFDNFEHRGKVFMELVYEQSKT